MLHCSMLTYVIAVPCCRRRLTANLPTKILDVRGFDSNMILVSRGMLLMSIGYIYIYIYIYTHTCPGNFESAKLSREILREIEHI